MYLTGQPHPLKESCARALQVAIESGVELVTDAEVLQEIVHRYVLLRRAAAAREALDAATTLCGAILPVRAQHVIAALDLVIESPRLSPRDAIHVAVMRAHDLTVVLTPDRDFDAIDLVQRIDPTALA